MASVQTLKEEVANSLTHGLGMVLSAAGLAVLIVLSVLFGDVWRVVSCTIYGSTLLWMYTMSTVYHTARSPSVKRLFKLLDHIAIFLLIAGTYTPFMLVLLRDGWGWTLFGVIWGCALLGILFKIYSTHRFRNGATVMYLIMGWMAVIALKPMLAVLDWSGMFWIIAGGLLYTGGTFFYLWKRLPYHHAIWHVFVLAGSACHYFAVLFYVVPL